MTTQLVTDLRAARALLAKGWCQGALARDRAGLACGNYSKHAVSFCATGAIRHEVPSEFGQSAALRLVKILTVSSSLVRWNDDRYRTQKQVLRLFDRAIAAAEKASPGPPI